MLRQLTRLIRFSFRFVSKTPDSGPDPGSLNLFIRIRIVVPDVVRLTKLQIISLHAFKLELLSASFYAPGHHNDEHSLV